MEYEQFVDGLAIHRNTESILKYKHVIDNRKTYDITIVIPTFKREEGIDAALKSISDSKGNLLFEVIIVDNEFFDFAGSSKEKILKKYLNLNIRYFQNKENIGLFGNWNRCVELATTRWVAMLHDDDTILPDYFDKLERFWLCIKDSKDIAYIKALEGYKGRKKKTFRDGPIQYYAKDLEVLGANIGLLAAPSCGTLINKEIFISVGGYNEQNYPSEDAYYIVRILKLSGYKVFRTSQYMGEMQFANSVSYREETIEAYAKEFNSYMQYYSTWNSRTKMLYSLFKNEMVYTKYKVLANQIMASSAIYEPQKFIEKIYKIMGEPKKSILLAVYRMWYKVHMLEIELRRALKTRGIAND